MVTAVLGGALGRAAEKRRRAIASDIAGAKHDRARYLGNGRTLESPLATHTSPPQGSKNQPALARKINTQPSTRRLLPSESQASS
eukprot:3294919-Pyramimonas_sp.AAC.2